MNRRLSAVAVSILVFMLSVAAFQASAANRITYEPRAKGPLKVSGSPTALVAPDSGNGYSGLGVLNGPQGLFEFFPNDEGNLGPAEGTALPGPASFSDSLGTYADPEWATKAFSHPQAGTVSMTRVDEESSRDVLVNTFDAGTRPSSASVVSRLFSDTFMPEKNRLVAVTDEAKNTFSYFDSSGDGEGEPMMSAPVGSQPVAADSFAEILWFVANRGSDDVSVLRVLAGDAHPVPSLETIQTVPVGDGPVDLTNVDFRGPEQMIAVVNHDSDTVSILALVDESTGSDMRVVQEIEVGDQPTSITPVKVNRDSLFDLAVTNSGSDDVSLLINEGGERFSHGQKIEVGERPVAIAAMTLNRYFPGDLAVANSGDGSVSLLLKTPSPGECRGRPAWMVNGTASKDELRGSRDPDVTRGLGGNDSIRGSSGSDCLIGGSGQDTIFGGFNDDIVSGGGGKDKLSGFNGNDVIRGGAGDDFICDSDRRYECYDSRGDSFRDYLPDRDRIFGGPGEDRITVGPRADRVDGGSGNDVIMARDTVRDRIDCGPGRDVVHADLKDKVQGCEKVVRPEPSA